MIKDRKCSKYRTCRHLIYRDNKTGLCLPCFTREHAVKVPTPVPVKVQIAHDGERDRLRADLSLIKSKYAESLKTIERQERALRGVSALQSGVETYTITPKLGTRSSEGTVVLVASDWHVEQRIGAEVGNLNRFSLDIAKERATRFFQAGLRLTNLLSQDIKITTMVLALLGDFVTNDIHDAESAEANNLLPMHAIGFAQGLIVSGIEFLLKNSTINFVVPCHVGNHSRTTQKTRFASEQGHSLEYLMYLHLSAYFRNEPRITFIVPEGMHSYLKVYDTTIRFHHGHAIKYGGGVGGIYIPVNKSISQWNKGRHADLDVFGHFHQLRDGGNFICNGSLVGYDSFALSIKADFDKPRQALFLMDRKRGRTCLWPIIL